MTWCTCGHDEQGHVGGTCMRDTCACTGFTPGGTPGFQVFTLAPPPDPAREAYVAAMREAAEHEAKARWVLIVARTERIEAVVRLLDMAAWLAPAVACCLLGILAMAVLR